MNRFAKPAIKSALPTSALAFLLPSPSHAVEKAPRIMDREIVERLSKIETKLDALEKQIDDTNKRIDDHSEMNGRFESIDKRGE